MATNVGGGGTGKPTPEMSVRSLQSQEERDRQFNALNAIRVRPGKPLAKESLASHRQKYLEREADELVSIWEHVRYDPPVFQNRESEYLF